MSNIDVGETVKEAVTDVENNAFTERVLLCLRDDVTTLNETSQRVTAQLRALAIEHGIAWPDPASV